MNRANYYNYIEEKLHALAQRITTGGKLNMLALHLHSESFYQHFFNLLYGYNLINLNQESQNVEAIDLIDRKKKIIIQVSSTSTKAKIEGALDKKSLVDYSDYTFKFISIAKDASSLRKNTYKNPHSINFVPSRDIYDIASLLNEIKDFDIDKLKEVFDFIQKELGDNSSKLNSNLTTKLGKSTIKGRKKELQEIKQHLNSSKALLIHGIGGIGKSTIASYYLHQNKNKFDYYGFFEGLDDFVNKLEIAFKIKVEQGQDRLAIVLHELTKLKGTKLLVIDNIQEVTENKKTIERILDLKEHDGFKILLTSREEIDGIDKYLLDTLSMDEAKEFFNSIYKVEDEVLLKEILEYLDCHAFFVEMTAKTLKSKKTLTPEIIKDKFEKGKFSTIKRNWENSFNDYLNMLFPFDKLGKKEILIFILKQLSILPSIEIEFEFLQEIFDKKDDEEFEEILNYLCEKGWLICAKGSYKLHQIIKEFMLANYTPILEEIQIIIDFFFNKMQRAYTLEEHLEKHEYLSYLESFISISNIIENEQIAYLIHSAGYLNRLLGNYKKAEKFYKVSFEIRKEILNEDDINFALSLNGKASMKEQSGNYQEALKLYLKSLSIREKYFEIYRDKVAIEYNNVGRMYEKLKKYDEAYSYLSESLQLRIEIFGEESEFTARAYNVLGSFLRDKANRTLDKKEQEKIYRKIYEYSYKALEIRINVLSANHPDTARSYMNVGVFYADNKEYDSAIQFFKISLDIYEKAIGDYSLNIAEVFSNMGSVLINQKKIEEAIILKEKAFNLLKNILPHNHPYLLNLKNEINRLNSKYGKPK